ncbi:MAG: exodeoxyribonuclease VII large subunit, partial [Deferribacteraceae bacterium]|nr:exodeoxyribonuclease VII large subunit [Deferribacteraceae bacterium]
TGFSRAASGHIYFTLKDADAKIKCVYFSWNILRRAFIPTDGDKVEVVGQAKVYAQEGLFQIVVKQVRYDAVGEYWKAFDLLRRKLEAEGLFDAARKRQLVKYPKKIALLTAENGAAVTDFLVTAKAKGLFFSIDIYPIPVQGASNAPIIAQTITRASSGGYDLLVLTRGGGALEDLAVFNDERVLRALAASKAPTLSAIGHERDITLADYVCDLRAATPTAAAELLIKEYILALPILEKYQRDFTKSLRNRLEIANMNIDDYSRRLYTGGVKERLKHNNLLLDKFARLITARLTEFVYKKDRELLQLSGRFAAVNPDKKLHLMKTELSALHTSLLSAAERRLKEFGYILLSFEERLRLTDPNRLLAAGYSVIYKDGAVVVRAAALKAGDNITIKVQDGAADALVERVRGGELLF